MNLRVNLEDELKDIKGKTIIIDYIKSKYNKNDKIIEMSNAKINTYFKNDTEYIKIEDENDKYIEFEINDIIHIENEGFGDIIVETIDEEIMISMSL